MNGELSSYVATSYYMEKKFAEEGGYACRRNTSWHWIPVR